MMSDVDRTPPLEVGGTDQAPNRQEARDRGLESSITARIDLIMDLFEDDGGELWRVFERILDAPHSMLQRRSELVPPSEAYDVSAQLLAASMLEPDALALTTRRGDFHARGGKWRFLRVFDERNEVTCDTVPNRFVATFLRTLLRELRAHGRDLERIQANPNLLLDVRALASRIEGLARQELFASLGSLYELPHDNLVLSHDPRYRRVMLAQLELLG
ncbi:MAG: DUF2357 domain-containing protein [Myxococcota bacterium]|jgi:predicted component of viral defense system (DUF524 family)|nr:DUF2357 domain-containing protein [Myxococcota bacterium]